MNLSDLENELRGLRPTAPAPDLERRIADDLSARSISIPTAGVVAVRQPSRFRQVIGNLGWASLGAAAALAVTVLPGKPENRSTGPVRPRVAEVPVVTDRFEQDEATQELLSAEEGSVVYESDQGPSRVVRYSSLERRVWSNPATGARVEVEVPRQDIVLIPISFQ